MMCILWRGESPRNRGGSGKQTTNDVFSAHPRLRGDTPTFPGAGHTTIINNVSHPKELRNCFM